MPPTRLTTTAPPITTTWKPARTPTPAADVLTPVLTGAALGLAALVGIGAVGFAVEWPVDVVAKLAGLGFAVVFAFGLVYGLEVAHGTLHETIETITQRDLDGDGDIGGVPHFVTTNQPQPLSAQERQMQVLWRFIAWSFASGKTAFEDAHRAGFTEDAWTNCKRVLDAAGVTERTRAGDAAGWRLTPATAEACWREVSKGNGGFYLQ